MQPRRIARELALLGISQLPATPSKLDQKGLEDLLLAAIRTLSEEAQDALGTAADEVRRSDRLLQESEQVLPSPLPTEAKPPSQQTANAKPIAEPRSETNAVLARIQQVQHQLSRTETAIRTAQSPRDLQSELLGLAAQASQSLTTATQYFTQLEQRLQSARQIMVEAIALSQEGINRVGAAIELPEVLQLAQSHEVRAFALELLTTLQTHKEAIDQKLQTALVGWQLGRLGRIDRDIMRLAVVEMEYLDNVPARIAINEAVELAKKYGNEESSPFINGVLRRVVDGPRSPESVQAPASGG